jgi:hypothetical protein
MSKAAAGNRGGFLLGVRLAVEAAHLIALRRCPDVEKTRGLGFYASIVWFRFIEPQEFER